MKFGTGLSLQHPLGVDLWEQLTGGVERAKRAEAMGFDFIGTGQHYVAQPYQMLQPFPVLAFLAPQVKMRLVATIIVPLQNPVDLAEQIATLDVLSRGRITLDAALGYRDEEYHAFGIPRRVRAQRMEETLKLLPELWTKDQVTFHGSQFHLDRSPTGLKPVQRPHPPIWVAATSDPAIQRAGRLGLPWAVAPAEAMSNIIRHLPMYEKALKEAGHPKPKEFIMIRGFCVRERRAEAWELAEKYLGAKFATYSRWGQDRAVTDEKPFAGQSFQELASEHFIIGDPDDCMRGLERLVALGATHTHLYTQWPGVPVEQEDETLRVFGAKIQPAFKG